LAEAGRGDIAESHPELEFQEPIEVVALVVIDDQLVEPLDEESGYRHGGRSDEAEHGTAPRGRELPQHSHQSYDPRANVIRGSALARGRVRAPARNAQHGGPRRSANALRCRLELVRGGS